MFKQTLRIIRNPYSAFDRFLSQIIWQIGIPISNRASESVHVDLGSGNSPRNPFGATKLIGTDFHSSFTSPEGVEFVQLDLTRQLPFEDSSIDSISAYDVLEHIPRWERFETGIEFPFIRLMSEIYRCLKPGGIFLAVTPAFPSPSAFQDPTHVNFISSVTINYFIGPTPWAGNLEYGFNGKFNLVCQTWIHRGVGGSKNPPQNLLNEGIIKKLAFIMTLPNVARLALVSKNSISKKPSHLLWVISKPE